MSGDKKLHSLGGKSVNEMLAEIKTVQAMRFESYWREKIAGELERKLDDLQYTKSDYRLSYFEGKEVGLAIAISSARGSGK